jgi:hypothetical protein
VEVASAPGEVLDRKRAGSVAPVFGVINAALGFRPCLLRGLAKVRGKWNLIWPGTSLQKAARTTPRGGTGLKRQNQPLNAPPGGERGGGLDCPCTLTPRGIFCDRREIRHLRRIGLVRESGDSRSACRGPDPQWPRFTGRLAGG